MDNGILEVLQKGKAKRRRIDVVNHPLPPGGTDDLQGYLAAGAAEYIISFFMVVSLSFTMAAFVVGLVKERVSKAKHLQVYDSFFDRIQSLAML